jgi:hypothetical protein
MPFHVSLPKNGIAASSGLSNSAARTATPNSAFVQTLSPRHEFLVGASLRHIQYRAGGHLGLACACVRCSHALSEAAQTAIPDMVPLRNGFSSG